MPTANANAVPGALTRADLQDPQSGNNDERRSEVRTAHPRFIDMMPCAGGDNSFQKVWMADCSRHGIGILTPEEMDLGERFLVKLDWDGLLLLVYVVRNCVRVQGTDTYRVGGQLAGVVGNPDDQQAEKARQALLGDPTP